MIVLAKNGNTDYKIVLAEDASISQEWAAKQLNKYFKISSNCEFNVEKDSKYQPKSILLGDNHEILKEIIPDLNIQSLGDEGFHIKTINETIIIVGSKVRGTVYGVFSFLEEYLGCRFYSPEIEIVPKKDIIEIPDIDNRQLPDFEYRMITYMTLMEPKSSAKLKNNMNPFTEEKYGGAYKFSMQHMTHTFYQLLSPKKYFKDHPEYFALVDGERQSYDAQLCLTNPDVLKIAKEQVLKWIEIDPTSMSFGVVQNDVNRWCECDNCTRIDDEEEAHSGSLLYFVNEIAKEIKEKHPNIYIHTIAYTYTEKAPKNIKPEDNVIVVLCHMHPSCDNHPIEKCPIDQPYVTNLKAWLAKTENIMVWHYVVTFKHYLLPFPNFPALSQDIPFYKKNGVKGFLGQSEFSSEQEFQELRNYVGLKLAWNINLDLQKLYDEHFKDVYGPAGKYVQTYFNQLQERGKLPDVHMHLYSGLEAGYIDDEFIEKSVELLNQALEATNDEPIYFNRVRRVRMNIDYTILLKPSEYVMKLGVLSQKDLSEKIIVLKRFKEDIKEFGADKWGEDIPMKRFIQYCNEIYREHSIEGLLETAPMVMKIINQLLNAVNSIKDKKNNFPIIKMAGTVLKTGLDPRTLMQWFQDKDIARYNENNIWERKIIPENIENMRDPKLPEADLTMVKAIAGKYFED